MNLVIILLMGLSMVSLGCSSGTKRLGSEESIPFTTGVGSTEVSVVRGTCSEDRDQWKSSNWRRLNQMTNQCLHEKKWNAAEALGHYISETYYFSPWGPYYLSIVHEQRGSRRQALWFAELALSKAKQEVGLLHYQRSKIVHGMKDYPEAYRGFEAAVKADPRLWDAHIYLGRQAYLEGEHSKAIEHLGVVLENNQLLQLEHVKILASAHEHQRQWTQALEVMDRGIKDYPKDVDLRLGKAKIFEEHLKDFRSALHTYEQILVLQNKSNTKSAAAESLQNKILQLKKNLEQEKDERAPASPAGKA